MSDTLVVLHTAIAIIAIVLLIVVVRVDPVISLVIGTIYLGLTAGLGFPTRARGPSGSIGRPPDGSKWARHDGRDADRRHTGRIRLRRSRSGNRGDSRVAERAAGNDVDIRNFDRVSYRRAYHVHLWQASEIRAMEQE